MTTPDEEDGAPERRFWPEAHPPEPEEGIDLVCSECGTPWSVHRDMAGFRLRCRCGAWVVIPSQQDGKHGVVSGWLEPPDGDGGAPGPGTKLVRTRAKRGEPEFSDLRHAPLDVRKRYANRSFLVLAFVLGAFYVPAILVQLWAPPSKQVSWMPVASVFSGLFVVTLGLLVGDAAFRALRRTAARYFIEAGIVGAFFVVAAHFYVRLVAGNGPEPLDPLIRDLGWYGALFVVAFCPAVFEEIAFRGIVQNRCMSYFGVDLGIMVTAVAFGLAHGLGLGLPLQMGAGFYLGYLRARSGSLIPGMLMHFLYNGSLVLLAAR